MIWETERLRFRPFTQGDFAQFYSLDSDPDVVRFLGSGNIRSEADSRNYLERVLSHHAQYQIGLCLTERIADGVFLGRTGLIPCEIDGEAVWEVGYTFNKAAWGFGFATEAAIFWRNIGFERLPVPFLVSLIHPKNEASMSVAKKNGMTFWKDSSIHGHACKVYRVDRQRAL